MHRRRSTASLSGILRMHHYYVVIWLFGVDVWRSEIHSKNAPLYVVICLLKVDMWLWPIIWKKNMAAKTEHVSYLREKRKSLIAILDSLTFWPTMSDQHWPTWICAERCRCIFFTSGVPRLQTRWKVQITHGPSLRWNDACWFMWSGELFAENST